MEQGSAEKRSVSADALETLGTIIGEGAGRDAIHLAVEPVISAELLYPGQNVGLLDDGRAASAAGTKKALGIVDPFLKDCVQAGERFWLVVYPRQITSLRHVWSHPDFTQPRGISSVPTKEDSEAWLRNFCGQANDCPDYWKVLGILFSDSGTGEPDDNESYINPEYLFIRGQEAHGDIPPEFWMHAEIVTGKKFANRPDHFSCGC